MKTVLIFFSFLLFLNSQKIFSTDIEHIQKEAEYKQKLAQKIINANVSQSANQQQYDVFFYELNLYPDVTSEILYGNVTIHAISKVDQLSIAEFDLMDNMSVDSVFVDGQVASFEHKENYLTVNLDKSYKINGKFSARVVYYGNPRQTGLGAFAFDYYRGKPMVWTLSEPFGARNWWPCKDIPEDKADSVFINVTVRSDLIVASNGLLDKVEESSDRKTYFWKERYPISTYLVSLAIYPYSTFSDWYIYGNNDSMEVQFYVFPDHVNSVKDNYLKTVDMIKVFSDIFGQYPFINEKYGHAEFLWGGGMEHQTLTSLGGWGEGLIVHELAHQWWGDMVTCENFHHIWLNEGFATYSEALWWESLSGQQALHSDMARKAYIGPGTIYVEDPLNDNIFIYNTTYAKAAWVLHMLRHVVGDDSFFKLLKSYYTEYKYKTVTTEQFKDLCEEQTGYELDAFFDQWIYKSGVPEYEYFWEARKENSNTFVVSLTINQDQTSGMIFNMPIDITVVTEQEERTLSVGNDKKNAFYEFNVLGQPISVTLDKDNWILKTVNEIKKPLFVLSSYNFVDNEGQQKSSLNPQDKVQFFAELQNLGIAAKNVSLVLTTNDPYVNITKNKIQFGDIAANTTFDNNRSPFELQVLPDTHNHISRFDLLFEYSGGSSTIADISIPIGTPDLLLVDDDMGADYETYYQNAAFDLDIYSKVWSNLVQGTITADEMFKYSTVIWFTGDDSETTLTTEEQNILRLYLEQGGRLLLTGQDIGYDLVRNGSEADSNFYSTVLHAKFINDQVVDIAVIGLANDPVGANIPIRFVDIFGGAQNQNSPSVIQPVEPAVASFMYYPSQSISGIRYENSNNSSRLVYLAFGLEGIAGPKISTMADVLQSVLQWLVGPSFVDVFHNSKKPDDFFLGQNYPNPFNSGTNIPFFAQQTSFVKVNLFNVLGQNVATLFEGETSPGWHTVQWDGSFYDGSDAKTGVYFIKYFYKSENKSGQKTVKMLKIN